MSEPTEQHGLLAVFPDPQKLLHATAELKRQGFSALDAFTPYPVEGLSEALGQKKSHIPVYAFFGGAIGGLSILALQAYSTLVDYPINVGSRQLDAWSAFVVPAFECVILGAALTAFVGMLIGNRLPKLYHPVFNAPSFSFAGEDRFFLLVGRDDPRFDTGTLRDLFGTLDASAIEDVDP